MCVYVKNRTNLCCFEVYYMCNELGVCEGLGGQSHNDEQNTIREDIIV